MSTLPVDSGERLFPHNGNLFLLFLIVFAEKNVATYKARFKREGVIVLKLLLKAL